MKIELKLAKSLKEGTINFLLYVEEKNVGSNIDINKVFKQEYKHLYNIKHEATINSYIKELVENEILLFTKDKNIYKLNANDSTIG